MIDAGLEDFRDRRAFAVHPLFPLYSCRWHPFRCRSRLQCQGQGLSMLQILKGFVVKCREFQKEKISFDDIYDLLRDNPADPAKIDFLLEL